MTTASPKWTQSNAQQNIEQPQTPTMGATTNRKSTTTKPPPQNGQQPKPPGGPNAPHRHQTPAPDSAVVEAQKCPARMEAIQPMQCTTMEKHSNQITTPR